MHHPNKAEVGISCTAPLGLLRDYRTLESALFNPETIDVKSYPLDLSGVQSCQLSIVQRSGKLAVCHETLCYINFGEYTQAFETQTMPSDPNSPEILTFTLSVPKD